jgi:hypothetical protein
MLLLQLPHMRHLPPVHFLREVEQANLDERMNKKLY